MVKRPKKRKAILTISDLHAPFHHPDALKFLAELKKEYKPDSVICLGDEVDQHTLARWPVHPEAQSTLEEWRGAMDVLQGLFKLFPSGVCVESNHSGRHIKKAASCGIPSNMLLTQHMLYNYPSKWKVKDKHLEDNILFIHGEGYSGMNGARNAAVDFKHNVVIGHLHSNAGVSYVSTYSPSRHGNVLHFGANAGCLIDTKSYAVEYGKFSRQKPCIGTIVIINEEPTWKAL